MHCRFQLSVDSETPDFLYTASVCEQRDASGMYTGAGLILVFVKLPCVTVP